VGNVVGEFIFSIEKTLTIEPQALPRLPHRLTNPPFDKLTD
jgi:hypothetical protein